MAYRDDRGALEERKAELEARLREVRAKLASEPSVESELLATIKTLEETYAELNVAKAPSRRSLPLLQRVHIASPCNVPWDSMQGDGRVRHCASCDKEVFDLSSLTREQAEALLIEKNGKLCATYFRRADGTILTADCDVGVAKKKKARRRAVVAAAAISTTTLSAVVVTDSMRPSTDDTAHVLELPTTIAAPKQHPTATPQQPPQQSIDVDGRFPRIRGGGAIAILPDRPSAPSVTRHRRRAATPAPTVERTLGVPEFK